MKFGVREICEVVLRAKDAITIGNKAFAKDEPVIYFDTLKTSNVEGAATTVYAQGGRGNSRLLAWEGERTVTFTMEDALLSPMGFAILSGAGLIDASVATPISVHSTANVVCKVAEGELNADLGEALALLGATALDETAGVYGYLMVAGSIGDKLEGATITGTTVSFDAPTGATEGKDLVVMVDFYAKMTSGVQQLEITPDNFAGYYYLEAMTLFRRQDTGKDMPAVFVIPKAKIQSAFTFSMASSGDPSTFTFTVDAFPDVTKFDQTKEVLFALQILGE